VALITIWCLGCSGYEPLLGSLSGAQSKVMSCASAEASDGGAATTISTVASSHDRFDCGCSGSCHAPRPVEQPTVAERLAIPRVEQAAMREPASVSRPPLLPPPETATL